MRTNCTLFFAGLLAIALDTPSLYAQEVPEATVEPWEKTQAFAVIGLSLPGLYGGTELNRAKDLRKQGLSYHQRADGDRRKVGNYPNPRGFNIGIGFFVPVRRVRRLMVGAEVVVSQTGSQPNEGGYEEGYFFNFLTASTGVKYYPWAGNHFFAKGTVGVSSVFTKNRFLNDQGEQTFFHQFGVGTGATAGLGYTLRPFKKWRTGLDLSAEYKRMNTRVEVNGVGDDRWNYGSFNFNVAFVW